MNLLIIYLLALGLAVMAMGAEPVNRAAGFDALGSFTVEVEAPAGSRQAVLEISDDLSPAATWRPMIACSIDGRAARVIFRLPPQAGGKVFSRVRTATTTTLPPVELTGEDLCFVTYADRIEEQAKIQFLSTAAEKMRGWSALPLSEANENLIAWARQDPAVAAADVSSIGGNVSVRFVDGTICSVMNPPRRYMGEAGGQKSAIAKSAKTFPPMPANHLATASLKLPGSNTAITAFSLEPKFPNSAPTIAHWLGRNNYSVTNFPTTTIEQALKWSAANPVGVMFWQAHGCPYIKADGSDAIGLVTGQFATHALSDGPYWMLLKKGELGMAIDSSQTVPYYTVNAEFIRKRVRFAPNSIVVVDACFGAHPELANGFLDAGAGSYASYDWLSGPYSGTPCLKVFDRLLGMNEEPPISDPGERPFSLQAIDWWMSTFQYDYDPSPKYPDQKNPNAKLTWYHKQAAPGYILRPSVMRVLNEAAYAVEPFTKYLIEGDFGTDPGESKREVRWGGVKMQVLRWEDHSNITIRMPGTPPVGNIEVQMHENFNTKSNLVPISEWTVPFTYEIFAEGSKYAKLEMTVKFRGDIHGSRGMPEMPVQYLPVQFSNMADCVGTASGSGTHSPDPATTVTWSGGSSLTSIDPNTGTGSGVRKLIWNSGNINLTTGTLGNFGLTADGEFTETEVVRHSDGTSTTTVQQAGIGLAGLGWPQPPLYVNPVTATFRGDTIHYPGADASGKLSWPSVTPKFAPTQATVR